MTDNRLPLSELLRPQSIRDLALPAHTISRFEQMLESQDPANMLFSGPPGTGKTTAAHIFLRARGDYGAMKVDGSLGVDGIRDLVAGFATALPFTPGLKVCFIDDGEQLSKQSQTMLRGLIESTSTNCRFIIAVNDITAIEDPVRSRLQSINFAIPKAERSAILTRLQRRIRERLTELGWQFNEARLDEIVADKLWDLRRMANAIEFEFRRP